MSRFLVATNRALNKHGVTVTYKSISGSAYNVETGTSTLSSVDYSLVSYPKQIKANQYSFPDLIGKEVILFYIANNSLAFTPKAGDVIVYKTVNYSVLEIQEHMADGELVLFRITTVRG